VKLLSGRGQPRSKKVKAMNQKIEGTSKEVAAVLDRPLAPTAYLKIRYLHLCGSQQRRGLQPSFAVAGKWGSQMT
jgi:hypothetical protein